jgi:MvdC family ATP-grasp ribosomal peptide maturase
MPPTVLLLTHSADHFTIDRVAAALERRGARPVRLDTDRFPRRIGLSVSHGPEGMAYELALEGGGRLSGGEVAAVWTRKFWAPDLGEELDPAFRDACRRQAHEALQGFLDGLAGARWIDPPALLRTAENKLRQLRLAAAAGLAQPRTLVSNEPERVRRFYDEVGGRMVAKVLAALSTSMDRSGPFVPTSAVSAEDLADLDSLRYAPMIFQERVEKAYELRVMFVAGRTYCGAIDAGASAAGSTDWRQAAPDEVSWRRGELPPEVAARLARLMGALGLAQGACDFIVTPAGEHVFLEVNPLGEWGMLERDLDLPISEALAAALLGEPPP